MLGEQELRGELLHDNAGQTKSINRVYRVPHKTLLVSWSAQYRNAPVSRMILIYSTRRGYRVWLL